MAASFQTLRADAIEKITKQFVAQKEPDSAFLHAFCEFFRKFYSEKVTEETLKTLQGYVSKAKSSGSFGGRDLYYLHLIQLVISCKTDSASDIFRIGFEVMQFQENLDLLGHNPAFTGTHSSTNILTTSL